MNPREHGGPDALGAPRWDFSTCSNALGPCPLALQALDAADPSRYPDPAYTRLRAALAAWHGVDAQRVVIGASASELIGRLSAALFQTAHAMGRPAPAVFVPNPAYGDYAHAARAWGLRLASTPDAADLVWACEPSSPLGQAHTPWPADLSRAHVVLDGAYAPLRLSGTPSLDDSGLNRVWQLVSPNKALGLTGVRAAYLIAPSADADCAGGQKSLQDRSAHAATAARVAALLDALHALAPSWPLGAHGVALLHAWVSPAVHAWLEQAKPVLRAWKARQTALLHEAAWQVTPSDAHFFCARPPKALDLADLRTRFGIKLRGTASMGLPGAYRLGVLAPEAQDALIAALRAQGAAS
ncbi:MAG: histidinol-phosphate transaminase [Rhodoferax sp.]